MSKIGRLKFALLALVVPIALVGCGSSASSDGGSSGGSTAAATSPSDSGSKLTTIKVGVIPIVDIAPLYLGMKKGFFADEGLKIDPEPAAGGAALIPSVISGDFAFGVGNPVSTIIAASKGLPIQMVAPGMTETTKKPAYSAVMVAKDSPIASVKDLAGKTIAVNALQNIGTLTIDQVLKKAGVDPKSVKFTEVQFPDMAAALKSHRVDAIWTVEPFVTQNRDAGAKTISEPLAETTTGLTVGTWFASTKYIEESPDIVKGFVSAIEKSNDYAEAHTAEARSVIPGYTQLPASLVKRIALGDWSSTFNVPSIELLGKLAEDEGLIDKQPDYGTLISK